MKKEERLNVKTEDENLKAMIIIIRDRGKGSITRATETAFSWLLDPETLKEKGAPFSLHYLSPEIRERILKGESIIDIANEISETKEAPDDPNKTFQPKAEISSSSKSDDKKEKEPRGRGVYR